MKFDLLLLVLLTLTTLHANAFTAALSKTKTQSTLLYASGRHYDFNYVLAKARVCAYNDHATEPEALACLQEILEFEDACMRGKLTGEPRCNDVLEIADTVAHLRAIILRGRKEGDDRNYSVTKGRVPCSPHP